ncbi:Oidioi.mRNA.OKI2018_I69.chr1.g1692.t1.cds [Oikopleura dioica]|uniref:Oidioi.mRNA.OKI2018_I69.chr1.g1682.t1.cds n=1 Tax=Oikopleura dioica TaxID=34765 RepID=A0ABN7SSX1_OIKDI|nr:Oidioi.mRNA.OKI2018_I69.chr1.g1682.t1.cds [Oikopleura dioica]CAG5104942.1 Oidioi.mRNA.OKI2018_I69.chr1.g1692.t1.cds [Oikopleura dioica]
MALKALSKHGFTRIIQEDRGNTPEYYAQVYSMFSTDPWSPYFDGDAFKPVRDPRFADATQEYLYHEKTGDWDIAGVFLRENFKRHVLYENDCEKLRALANLSCFNWENTLNLIQLKQIFDENLADAKFKAAMSRYVCSRCKCLIKNKAELVKHVRGVHPDHLVQNSIGEPRVDEWQKTSFNRMIQSDIGNQMLYVFYEQGPIHHDLMQSTRTLIAAAPTENPRIEEHNIHVLSDLPTAPPKAAEKAVKAAGEEYEKQMREYEIAVEKQKEAERNIDEEIARLEAAKSKPKVTTYHDEGTSLLPSEHRSPTAMTQMSRSGHQTPDQQLNGWHDTDI